jgi:cell division protein FtsA
MTHEIQTGVGIDAGSNFTRCVICAVEDGYQRLAGYAEVPSSGWNRGRVSDPDAVSDSIQKAIDNAERRAQMLVDTATVGIGGSTIASGNSRGLYEFGRPREIESRDLHYAIQLSTEVQLEHDRLLLQAAPQDFTVDGRAGLRSPQRMMGSRLEAHTHIITASAQEHDTLVDVVNRAHLNVEETVFEGMAAAYACVIENERMRGVAIADIGAHSTELVIYSGDAMAWSSSIPVGGDHFTRDVAAKFRIPFDDAELLKREHGCARLGLSADNSLIEIPSCEGRPARETLRWDLTDVLDARAEDLFKVIKQEIVKAGMEQDLFEGIVLCGGGALLYGMEDMAEFVLNCNCRKGPPKDVDGLPDDLNRADWATAFGLAMYSAKLKTRPEFKRKAPGFLGLVLK